MGAVPSGPAADAAEAWRQSGRTIKLDHLELYWDTLGITGSGSLALDADLQPTGSVSATIKGYDQLMTAFSVAGLLPADELTPAKIALAMLGPAISTHFTVQNGDSTTVRVPIDFTYAGLGSVWDQIKANGTLNYRVLGDLSVATPVGNFTIPYDQTGRFSPMIGVTR